MKKSTLIVGIALNVILCSNFALAKENSLVEVPGSSYPNSTIKYDNNLNNNNILRDAFYIQSVSQDKKVVPDVQLDVNKMTEKEKEEYIQEKKMLEQSAYSEKRNETHVEKVFATPGMTVKYDEEGYLDQIISPLRSYSPLRRGTTSPIGTYIWGAHNNKLVVNEYNNVIGTGRFTVFNDLYGEADNKLVKGDCATRGDKDNPKHGQPITTRRLNSNLTDTNYTHVFFKRDNGALPDAILDIWKDGTEYLGVSYNEYQSFNGRYFYHFE